MRSPATAKVPPSPAAPDRETLADAIVRISDGVQHLQRSGLNRKAILILLAHQSSVSQKVCAAVIDGLADLRRNYCT